MLLSDSCNEYNIVTAANPIEVMSGKITSEPSSNIIFTNYDVLLCPLGGDTTVRFASGNHVGNQRFRVLLSLSRTRYLQAKERGDKKECMRIARDVMITVYHKCVPSGRFFEQKRDNGWQEIRLGPSLLAVITSSLKNEPKDGMHLLERRPKRCCRRRGTGNSIVSLESITEDAISAPNRFDVIFEGEGLQLQKGSNHTGNNRLKVMLDMRKANYKKSNLAGKQRIAQEVVSSIIDDASSRFLTSDKSSGRYKPISRELASACIKNSLDNATEGDKRKFHKSEVKKLMDRKKKKALLGSIERRKGNAACRLSSDAAPPTTFEAFQPLPMTTMPGLVVSQNAAI